MKWFISGCLVCLFLATSVDPSDAGWWRGGNANVAVVGVANVGAVPFVSVQGGRRRRGTNVNLSVGVVASPFVSARGVRFNSFPGQRRGVNVNVFGGVAVGAVPFVSVPTAAYFQAAPSVQAFGVGRI